MVFTLERDPRFPFLISLAVLVMLINGLVSPFDKNMEIINPRIAAIIAEIKKDLLKVSLNTMEASVKWELSI